MSDQPSGVIIAGGLGSGKTAIVEQLVAHSCFADGKTNLVQGENSLLLITYMCVMCCRFHLYCVYQNKISSINCCS